jgi:DNA repair protein RadC
MKNDSDLNFGHRARLRNRFVKAGAESFSEHELLELLLTYSIPRKDTKTFAKRLLLTFGSLHEVLNASSDKLTMVEGIGEEAMTPDLNALSDQMIAG